MKRRHSLDVLVPFLNLLSDMGLPEKLSRIARSGLEEYKAYFDALSRRHGLLTSAKFAKKIYESAKRRMMLLPDVPQSTPIWYATRKGEILPKKLGSISRLLKSRKRFKRELALTILGMFRLMEHPIKVSYKTQLSPDESGRMHGVTRKMGELAERYNLFRVRVLGGQKNDDRFVSTAGPYGSPAAQWAHLDAKVLLREEYRTYLDACLALRAYEELPGEADKWLDTLKVLSSIDSACINSLPYERRRPCLARHVFLSEGGGKVRAVTPINYWIQQCLFRFHNYFMELLRRIPMDCSFVESKGVDEVARWSAAKLEMNSIDLSDATDRFPLREMKKTVEFFLPGLSDHWEILMRVPIVFGRTRQSERPFACGAPMGLYCMWPVYALTHHCMVQIAAEMAGYRGIFTKYRIRGDDIVLTNPKICAKYDKLTVRLRLPISGGKSLFSKRDGPGVAEFSKHSFYRGYVVRPASARQLAMVRFMDPLLAIDLSVCAGRLMKRLPVFRTVDLRHSLERLIGVRQPDAPRKRDRQLKRVQFVQSIVTFYRSKRYHKVLKPYFTSDLRKVVPQELIDVPESKFHTRHILRENDDLLSLPSDIGYRIMLKFSEEVLKSLEEEFKTDVENRVLHSLLPPKFANNIRYLEREIKRTRDPRILALLERKSTRYSARKYHYFNMYNRHPLVTVLSYLYKDLELIATDMFSDDPVYQCSLAIERFRSLKGITESLRKTPRKNIRAAFAASYIDKLCRTAEVLVAEKPPFSVYDEYDLGFE